MESNPSSPAERALPEEPAFKERIAPFTNRFIDVNATRLSFSDAPVYQIGGPPADTASVIGHMAKGDLEIESSTIRFEEIPEGLERLKRGGVIGRIVAAMD